MDAPYYFFHVVNEESFRIEHQRIILVLSQWLLLLGVKLHLSIPTLLALYSLTPVIYSITLTAIALFYFKSETGAIIIMLCNVCGAYFLYYCPMYEVYYAMITFGFICMLTQLEFYKTNKQMLAYLFVLLIALLGYPLIAFACLLLPLYACLIYGRKIPLRLLAVYAISLALWLLTKVLFISDYEKGKISVTPSEYPGILHQLLSFHFLIDATKFLTHNYPELIIAATGFVAFSILRRQYALLLIQLASIALYVFIVNFGYRSNGLIYSNNFERMYMLLVIICSAPLLFIAYPKFTTPVKGVVVVAFLLLLSYRSFTVWQHAQFFTNRLNLLNNFTNKYISGTCSKVAVDWDKLPHQLDQWGTGMEVLIYSSANGKSGIISNSLELDKINSAKPLNNNQFLLRLDEVMNRSDLNPKYFHLDSSGYCYITL